MKRRNFLAASASASMLAPLSRMETLGTDGHEAVADAEANASSDIPSIPVFTPKPAEWRNDALTMAWIGHSTVLINFYGIWVLTDPILFERIGIYLLGTNFGPTRLSPPALPFDAIPKPDLVLLSHAHMDHCDVLSLKRLTAKFPNALPVIVAKHMKDVVADEPWKSVQELDWNQRITLTLPNGSLQVQALEVKHFGWRLPGDPDRAAGAKNGRSFNAYLLERTLPDGTVKRVVFGGDTARTDAFKRVQVPVDVAIMPIGAYQPWRTVHCNPEEAVEMAEQMNARYFVPIHCNTFPLGREATAEPLQRLQGALQRSSVELALGAIGKTFVLPVS
jgi:L-ascorbate metabolism protein UlaG (beta-lactamase superfamily)